MEIPVVDAAINHVTTPRKQKWCTLNDAKV
jgi:hypothetical protein